MVIQRNRRSRGITLIEMMIAVAIVGVLAAIAAPNMRALFINNRLDTASNELLAALNLARSEAMRRGAPVTIRRTSATGREWTQGWEIFVDVDRNGVRDTANAQEELIRVGQRLAPSLTLFSSQIVSAFVPFSADGRIALNLYDQSSPLGTPATFILCYDGMLREGAQPRSRAVLLNSAGRARPGLDGNKNGIPEDATGADVVSCSAPF